MVSHTDDVLAVLVDPKAILMKIDQYFKLKPESIGVPTSYLGVNISRLHLPDGKECWAMGSERYGRASLCRGLVVGTGSNIEV